MFQTDFCCPSAVSGFSRQILRRPLAGSSALITPLSFASVTHVDALVLLLSVTLLLLWAYSGRRERIDRWEGALMLLLFGAYYYYLFINL